MWSYNKPQVATITKTPWLLVVTYRVTSTVFCGLLYFSANSSDVRTVRQDRFSTALTPDFIQQTVPLDHLLNITREIHVSFDFPFLTSLYTSSRSVFPSMTTRWRKRPSKRKYLLFALFNKSINTIGLNNVKINNDKYILLRPRHRPLSSGEDIIFQRISLRPYVTCLSLDVKK